MLSLCCCRTSYFLFKWYYIIVSQLHQHTVMNGECNYILLFLSICLPFDFFTDCSVADRMSRHLHSSLMAASLILLAVPNYHHFFMQPGSQDCLFTRYLSFILILSTALSNIQLKQMTYIWEANKSEAETTVRAVFDRGCL